MEDKKILNLLNEVNSSKFLMIKLNIVNDNSNANYNEEMKLSIIRKY